MDRVGIVAAGHVGFWPVSPGRSYKELCFAAAAAAYREAGIDPRRDVDSFVCASEDYLEGTSIFDAYVPDQIGGALRPVQTVAGDGLMALATGVMLIRSGIAEVVAVEAHSKVSDVATLASIVAFGFDPVFERPLLGGPGNPEALSGLHPWGVAGLEMRAFLAASATAPADCAEVVVTNRTRALGNPAAAYGAALDAGEVLASPMVADPLHALECPQTADGAVVVVLAAEARARALSPVPVWVDGLGWSTGSPSLSSRRWGEAAYAVPAVERAYRQAGISAPAEQLQVAEVDDTFAYKQLQHAAVLGLDGAGAAVNPSGGSLGRGYLFEANGLARVADLVAQLRGEAGACQVGAASRGVAQSWRGVPTSTSAVAVLSTDRPAT